LALPPSTPPSDGFEGVLASAKERRTWQLAALVYSPTGITDAQICRVLALAFPFLGFRRTIFLDEHERVIAVSYSIPCLLLSFMDGTTRPHHSGGPRSSGRVEPVWTFSEVFFFFFPGAYAPQRTEVRKKTCKIFKYNMF
jgi:hypothetical protein